MDSSSLKYATENPSISGVWVNGYSNSLWKSHSCDISIFHNKLFITRKLNK